MAEESVSCRWVGGTPVLPLTCTGIPPLQPRRYGERMAQTPLSSYYEGIEALSDRLFSAGALDWAEALTAAMRSGSTSGEILSNTGVVLRNLAESPDVERSRWKRKWLDWRSNANPSGVVKRPSPERRERGAYRPSPRYLVDAWNRVQTVRPCARVRGYPSRHRSPIPSQVPRQQQKLVAVIGAHSERSSVSANPC
jgi:hypothetical protein